MIIPVKGVMALQIQTLFYTDLDPAFHLDTDRDPVFNLIRIRIRLFDPDQDPYLFKEVR